MSFARYAEYKDSGVEWLGRVPSHWVICALNYRYEIALGKMLDEKRITGEHLAPYLRNVDVQWGSINIDSLPQMDFSGDDLARYSVAPGDLLVCEGGEVGRAAIWRGELDECFYQKALHRLRPRNRKSDHAEYLYYVFRIATTLGLFTGSEAKSTIAHLTAETLRRYGFPFPPAPEQIDIAAFLDRETGKIDALVAEQKKLIALLKQKRQAVISHAVTKGLNPQAPMKPSGIKWLGDVPADCEVTPLKHLVEFRSGGTPSKADEAFWNGAVPWVSSKDMKQDVLADSEDHITDFAVETGAADLLPIGAVLVVVRGMILAKMFPVAITTTPMAINQDLKGLLAGEAISPEFLAWYLRGTADESLTNLDEAGHGTKVLRMEGWSSLAVVVPTMTEQHLITAFVESETARLNVLRSEADRVIGLLKERRSALISAVVTGQIDVRGLAVAPADDAITAHA